MKRQAQQLLERAAAIIDERNQRERVLLVVTAGVVLFLLWSVLIQGPITARTDAAESRSAGLNRQIAALRESERDLEQRLAELRSELPRQRIDAARAELAELERRIEDRRRGFIAPQQMVGVLQSLVMADDRLELHRLRNLGNATRVGGGDDNAEERIFRHRAELVVDGEFFSLLAYLVRLENLGWQFQWDALELGTLDYPRARAQIEISTLSMAEDWLGI